MEANRSRRRWTYAEYASLPVPSEARGTRYEVIDGALFVTPSPTRSHQEIVGHLFWQLYGFSRGHGLGKVFVSPFDVLFGEGDYVEPDIVFVGRERVGIVSERGVEGPPDLVVEVLSTSTRARDRGIKLERYRHFGVAECWVIDPERGVVDVWKLAAGAPEPITLRAADTLRWIPIHGGPTLEISVGELFAAE